MGEFHFCGSVVTQKDRCFYDSDARVLQQMPNGEILPVADIHDHYADMDFRDTNISYVSGSMHFRDLYDTPLIFFPKAYFLDDKNEDVCLFRGFYRKLPTSHIHKMHHCLDFDGELFQIECGDRHSEYGVQITVYESQPEQTSEGLFYPVLATITVPAYTQGQWEYQIKVRRSLPLQLLMAVLSLPFTADCVPRPQDPS